MRDVFLGRSQFFRKGPISILSRGTETTRSIYRGNNIEPFPLTTVEWGLDSFVPQQVQEERQKETCV